MKILAIDPGTTQSAYILWNTEKQTVLSCGLMDNNPFVKKYISFVQCKMADLIAVEMIQNYGFQMGRSTIETIMFVGELKAFWDANHYDVTEFKLYGRPTIKGHFNAKKDAMIRASLRMRYGEHEFKKGGKFYGVKKDIWSAMAIAVALTENPNLKEW